MRTDAAHAEGEVLESSGYTREQEAGIIQVFKERTEYTPTLDPPTTFNEKVLYRKLYDRRSLLPLLTCKIQSRNYIRGKSEAIEVPILAEGTHYNLHEEVGFPFIVKPNNKSGRTRMILNEGSWSSVYHPMIAHSGVDYGYEKGEWAYSKVPFTLILEPVLSEYREVKFMCFNGSVFAAQVIAPRKGRMKKRLFPAESFGVSHFNSNGVFMHAKVKKWPLAGFSLPDGLPFQRMVECASLLSKGMDFVRVDLLWCEGKIYFGEYTLYPGAGHTIWEPREFDLELGNQWRLWDGS